MPRVTILNRTSVRASVSTGTAFSPRPRDLDTGETLTIARDYLVGCDGGRSMVRKAIGAKLAGTPVIQSVQSTYIRAPGLLAMMGAARPG